MCFNVSPPIEQAFILTNEMAHKRRATFSLLPEPPKTLLLRTPDASMAAKFSHLSVLDVFFFCSQVADAIKVNLAHTAVKENIV